jgi:hypothetical protein
MLLLLFAGGGSAAPPSATRTRRPVMRSAGSRSNWRKYIVTNLIFLALLIQGGA